MSLSASQLVNGSWATHNVSLDDVVARHRAVASDSVGLSSSPTRQQHLGVGLLSRTLTRSPTIRWIIPARIRHKDKNDVVFVGEDFIHVKQYLHNGNFQDIATKADFGARIMAIKVLRSTRETARQSFIDEVLKQKNEGCTSTSRKDAPTDARPVLVLTLASRKLVFLLAHEDESGKLHFHHAQRALPAEVPVLDQQGRHLAVDPR